MRHHRMKRRTVLALAFAALALGSLSAAHAAGTLTPVGSPDAPIQIRDHNVRVVIHNGFAQTEVRQTFFNPNDVDLEAHYSFPLPESASLSEVTIIAGERELHGEVLERDHAAQIYEEERDQGNDAGLATKNGYQTFDFLVSPVRAQDSTGIRFVYYQPLAIDTGIGRYLYPLEDGGTDELAASFWLPNTRVEGSFSVELELKSAWPVAEVRVPGFENEARVEELDTDHYRIVLERQGASLDRDFVFYYRLADGLPGRLEMVAYRADESKPGTFMLVLTPGIDLKPLNRGADYTFVLDVSGSMDGKIRTLADGVGRALGDMQPQDRFRIVTFNNSARRLTRGWMPATPENAQRAIDEVASLAAGGSTNLYAGLRLALDDLDDDRASSVVLVTDAVTNTGIIDPREFYQLMKQVDVRVFGFLMGNSANWPLMRTICEASGGFSASVSNQDDILGQILLAKSKITHEALHDTHLRISGVKVSETSEEALGKVYRGQQVVFFGRYEEGGKARVKLETRMSGEDKVYTTSFDFPDVDTDHPELERLWALHRIEAFEVQEQAGLLPATEADDIVRNLGLEYQLVTDETSMVVLTEEAYLTRGIERHNQKRVAREREAQARRAAQPVRSRRVDTNQPMFDAPAPRPTGGGGGSGAIDPISGLLALGLAGMGLAASRRRR
ncbi:MAG: VWA domain-containing protein [bacterium]|nr:VWA domain-containing protein [bacterium]